MDRSVSSIIELFQFCPNSRKKLVFAYVASAIFALFDVATIFVLFKVLQSVPSVVSGSGSDVVFFPDQLSVEFTAAIYLVLVLTITKLILGSLVAWYRSSSVFKCQEELQLGFMAQIFGHQVASDHEIESALDEKEAVSVVTIDTGLFNSAALALGQLFIDLFAIAGLIIFLAITISPQAILAVGVLLLIVFLTFRALRKHQKAWASSRLEAETQRLSSVVEVFRLNVEFPWGVSRYSESKLRSLLLKIRSAGSLQATLQTLPRLYLEFLFFFALGLLLLFVTDVSSVTELSGDFVALALAGFRALPSISKIFNSFNNIRNAEAGCIRLLNRLSSKQFSVESKVNEFLRGYPGLNTIKNLFDEGTNSIIGLAGRSGVGKSTFLRLLHLHAIEIGRCSYYLPPNPVLISGTLQQNICPDTLDGGAISHESLPGKVLFSTNRFDPQNVDVEVYDNGKNFSSGERQRVAIARAVVASNDLLILDENLSNLDVDGAKAILHWFKALRHDGLLIIVTHNKSLLGFCDQVIEM